MRCISRAVLLAVLAAAALPAASQERFPSRPVRIVVPFPPGGTSDIVTRILGEKLSVAFGQTIVVDNRPGAAGMLGTDIVAKANPDGHTLFMAFVSHSINPFVYAKLPYDTVKDFAPVALVAVSPNVVVVTPSVPANSIRQLVDLAKAKPGQINYASSGLGSNSHLSAEMLNTMAGIRLNHVPYKGGPQANTDTAAGAVQVHIPSLPVTVPFIRSGRLRAIAVTSAKRSPVLPEVATVAETLPGYESLAWYGLLAPAKTPPAVIARISAEVQRAVALPDVSESLAKQGADPTFRDQAGFARYLDEELQRWGAAVKAAGIKPGQL
jgi:tripartite-type tricarboxylate transporter receptor subunit TctC